jgi:site-specific DNA recombinase
VSVRAVRCAIYTRKSSDEGLEQSFNSLDAQREACVAYIQSQRHEGWKLLPHHYDDGGFSGGTMDRPALRSLLSDIDAGRVDLVVVYKVDRLTRALTDFAKIVERFDAKAVSFVSVTQSFNTTTSMGRLTLNVLLSFAQFEREVTGERIRDKIAASKRKGMWMGGLVPLGYDVNDRKLVVNTSEAAQVQHIFERYRVLANVDALRRELKDGGYRSKVRIIEGKRTSFVLSNGALTRILTNPLYRGHIHHRGELHPGQHQAIVSEGLWTSVKSVLIQRQRSSTTIPRAQGRNPLLGLLTDGQQRSFYASYTKKPGHAPYRYYVTKRSDDHKALRLPAEELEAHVRGALVGYVRDAQRVLTDLRIAEQSRDIKATLSKLKALAEPKSESWTRWRLLLVGVVYANDALTLSLDRVALAKELGIDSVDGAAISIVYPVRLHRTGHDLRLVIPAQNRESEAAKRNPSLIKFIAQGRKWYKQLTTGQRTTLKAIAAEEGVTERYIARVMRGSLLAPDIIQQVLDGKQPVTLTVQKLMQPFPSYWVDQRRFFGV